MRKDAEAHLPLRIYEERIDSRATVIELVPAARLMHQPIEPFGEPQPTFNSDWIQQVEPDNLLRIETHGKRTLCAVDARIHHPVKLEFKAEALRKSLHFPDFVLVGRHGDALQT
jgi:hypothetical protein